MIGINNSNKLNGNFKFRIGRVNYEIKKYKKRIIEICK